MFFRIGFLLSSPWISGVGLGHADLALPLDNPHGQPYCVYWGACDPFFEWTPRERRWNTLSLSTSFALRSNCHFCQWVVLWATELMAELDYHAFSQLPNETEVLLFLCWVICSLWTLRMSCRCSHASPNVGAGVYLRNLLCDFMPQT